MARRGNKPSATEVAAAAVLRARWPQEGIDRFGTQKAWAAETGVSETTISGLLTGGRVPTLKTLNALAESLGLAVGELNRLVTTQLDDAQRDAFPFPFSRLPTVFGPIAPYACFFRWAAHANATQLTQGGLLGLKDSRSAAHQHLVYADWFLRPARFVSLILAGTDTTRPDVGLAKAPFGLLPLDYAQKLETEAHSRDPGFRLLVLNKWSLELKPATFALIGLDQQQQHDTTVSGFHRVKQCGHQSGDQHRATTRSHKATTGTWPEAKKWLAEELRRPGPSGEPSTILCEPNTPTAIFLHALLEYLGFAGHEIRELVSDTPSISASLALLLGRHLRGRCYLAATHPQLWAIRTEERLSPLHLMFTDEHPLPKQLLSVRPAADQVLVIRDGALSPRELEISAAYFHKLAVQMIRYWSLPVLRDQVAAWVMTEYDRYGGAGKSNTSLSLTSQITDGMTMHIASAPHPFVPLATFRQPSAEELFLRSTPVVR